MGGYNALQNLSKYLTIYYTWKNIRKQCKNNKLKGVTTTWNDEFELPNGLYSVSDIQDHIEYIIKKHEKLTAIPRIHVYMTWLLMIEIYQDLLLKNGLKFMVNQKRLSSQKRN